MAAVRPLELAAFGWGDIVEAAEFSRRSARTSSLPATPRPGKLSWGDVVGAELAIAVHVISMLWWAPMCAFRACDTAAAEAFELWAEQPIPSAEFSWVRVPVRRRTDCLRFLAQHCRNVRSLAVGETAQFGEKSLLRLVCGMRLLESLDVGAAPFGGAFPDPQRLLDRLAKYCPRLQHLAITFKHETTSQRQTLEVRAFAWLGRRLLTLDLGAVAVRIAGGSRTLATCCPQLERLAAQLCQLHEQPLDAVDPNDLARGCPRLEDLDLAPIDWDDHLLERFMSEAQHLQSLSLRHVVPDASPRLLLPLVAAPEPDKPWPGAKLVTLHLALHARTDADRATAWLEVVAGMPRLRSLCLDYAAPLRLSVIVEALLNPSTSGAAAVAAEGGQPAGLPSSLAGFTVHGCHGVDDDAVHLLSSALPRLQQLRLFPDSWREVGDISDRALQMLVKGLPRLRVLAVSSRAELLAAALDAPGPRLRSFSLFAPLGDAACKVVSLWGCLRHLWLGPHRLMEHGVGAESAISDAGLGRVALGCGQLADLTVASRQVTDAGAKAVLLACRELRRLRLGGRGITDASLALLAALPQPRLERFGLWSSGTTAAGLRRAEAEMPWVCFDVEASSSA
uniref:F-box domain-containing protein n=1 Tax=Alexandrium monilatum TaxID=311494 RepID=A0A7S4W4J4_9DINO